MNQRVKRGSKKNRVDHISVATGGWTARQSTQAGADEVNVTPPKPTAQPTRGVAKASPQFKPVPAKTLPSVDDQKKALAENVVKAKKKNEEDDVK